MTDDDVLMRFTRILRDVLDDESIVLGMRTQRGDLPHWDSFAYVNFIVSVEMDLGIKFSVADVESFQTVGDIVTEVRTLLG